ncbi:hypothetical protein C8F04DRAFT_1203460 [Mycena alexandri]|uniref:Uncharacterized protein n=1 Tax=Mycena alexandri TaxID=1745969 RepID=A0AAD6RVY7_9AGAR|nr:hypothetical protein C8F04DRAFT_1203460 [Mycena alexandri]
MYVPHAPRAAARACHIEFRAAHWARCPHGGAIEPAQTPLKHARRAGACCECAGPVLAISLVPHRPAFAYAAASRARARVECTWHQVPGAVSRRTQRELDARADAVCVEFPRMQLPFCMHASARAESCAAIVPTRHPRRIRAADSRAALPLPSPPLLFLLRTRFEDLKLEDLGERASTRNDAPSRESQVTTKSAWIQTKRATTKRRGDWLEKIESEHTLIIIGIQFGERVLTATKFRPGTWIFNDWEGS